MQDPTKRKSTPGAGSNGSRSSAQVEQRGGYSDRKKEQGSCADEDPVTEASEESFPASDPHSWTSGGGKKG